MHPTKLGNQNGIGLICFGALELALAKGMSARRIDQTDDVPGLMESQSRFLCPGSSGFEAGVNRLASVCTEPRDECCRTRCVIGENLGRGLVPVFNKAASKVLLLTSIPKYMMTPCGPNCLVSRSCSGSALSMQALYKLR